MRGLRRISVLAVVLALTGAACGDDDTTEATPIRIGEVMMLTGSSGFYGEVIDEGIQLAVAEINASGGVDGRLIEIVKEDTASDDAQTVALVRRVAADAGVVAIIGPTFTSNYLAGQTVANELGIPWVAAGSGIPVGEDGTIDAFGGLPNPAPWTYQIMLPYGVMVTDHLKTVLPAGGVATVAVIWQQDNPAQAFTKALGDAAVAELGLEVVDDIAVDTGQGDYGPQITQLLASQPDAVLVNLVTEDAALFMRQASERGLETLWIGPNNGLLNDRLYELSAGGAEGLIVPSHLDFSSQATTDFVARFEAHFGHPMQDILSTFGYDVVYLLKAAIEAAEDPNSRESVRDALRELGRFCGISSCFEYDDAGNFLTSSLFQLQLTPDGFEPYTP